MRERILGGEKDMSKNMGVYFGKKTREIMKNSVSQVCGVQKPEFVLGE